MQILLIPASSPAALALARVLAAEGHIVHAADAERIWGTAPARYSRAYRRFHGLSGAWSAAELWKDIGDSIDLIIPFVPLPGHFVESLKARGANIVGETLTQDDSEFQDFVRDNIVNASAENPSIIKVPASFTVHSRTCIAEILSNRESIFSLQPLPCYDTDDEDTLVDVEHATPSASACIEPVAPIVISCSTLDDRTVEAIKRLPMSDTKPYRLIEVAEGGAFYSAHAFIHAGQVRTFVVTNTRATDRDFAIVGAGEPLYDLLYQFTKRLAEVLDGWQSVVANHLSLTFHLQDKITYDDFVRKVTVVSCRNDPHASLVLLAAVPELRRKLALAYTASTLREEEDSAPVQIPTNGRVTKAMYSAPLAIYGLTRILFEFRPWRRRWWAAVARMAMMCVVWAMNFKEEMWETSDPGPALCFWAVMLGDSLISVVGQVAGVKWGMTRAAPLRSKTLASYRMALTAFVLMLDICRWWVAIMLYPWYRTTQR